MLPIIQHYETNYTYFGARYYDSDLSSWLSVDPLAAARPNLSPYNYCQNNPVVRIDPTGLLDDEWDLYPNGKVKHANNNGGKTHHSLHAVDENGNRTGNSITVRNRDVLDQLSIKDGNGNRISRDNTIGSVDDVFKVFLFGTNNSNVEWGAARYEKNGQNMYAVYTDHSSNSVTMPHFLDLGKIISNIHSHPNTQANYNSEMFSMGAIYYDGSNYDKYIGYKIMDRSDWSNKQNNIYSSYPSYAYMKNSGNLYYFSKYKKPSFIRNVKSIKDLYFGTLNHR